MSAPVKRYEVECGETYVSLGFYDTRGCLAAALQAAERVGDALMFLNVLAEVRGSGKKEDHTSTHSFLVTKCGDGFIAEPMHFVEFHAFPGFRNGAETWRRLVHRRALARDPSLKTAAIGRGFAEMCSLCDPRLA